MLRVHAITLATSRLLGAAASDVDREELKAARDYLADKYPEHLQVDISGDKPQLKPKEGYDENNMPDFFSDLGLKAPVTSLDEDNVEQQLVPAARQRIAMDRQQLLATMVMMGVNRLVVTNGTIEASCMFNLDTTDARHRADAKITPDLM